MSEPRLPTNTHKITFQFVLFLTLGLLTVTLLAFAVISPFNGAQADDWIYPFYGKLKALTVLGSNRQFGLVPAVIAEIFTPGRMPYGMLTLQLLSIWGTALILFFLIRRLLSGYNWFALLVAVVYLLYIPNNGDQARTLYSGGVYPWVVLVAAAAALLVVEHYLYRGLYRWLAILLAAGCAYMTVRAYESAIPLIVCFPLLLIFKRRELLLRRLILPIIIWYSVVGFGVFQFVEPFFSHSSTTIYQNSFFDVEQTTLQGVLTDTLYFYTNSFPLDELMGLPVEGQGYLVPGLLLGLACLIFLTLFKRLYPENVYLPSVRVLVTMIFVGLVEIGLAIIAFAYAHIADTPRANFFAAPGQSLVVVGVVGLLALAVGRFLIYRPVNLLLGFVFFYGIVGASWYYQAQMYAVSSDQSFDVSLRLFREIVALVPNAKADTLILYDCNVKDSYQWRLIDSIAGIYLYDKVNIASIDQITWLPDRINYHFIDWLSPPLSYNYNQLILIGCRNNHLYIADSFPARFLPTGVEEVEYNPFARIINGFIPPERGNILGY
jgi:hypothetical protein